MLIDHSKLKAWALCWPSEEKPLLYRTEKEAEEARKWFSSNYKNDSNGNFRGEPFILVMCVKATFDK